MSGRAVGEHRRPEVEAVLELRFGRAVAARDKPRPLGHPQFDVALDPIAMVGRDQGAGFGCLVRPVAEPDAIRAPRQLIDEPVVDAVLDDQPAAGRTDLAAVQERGGQRVVDGGLEVGVGEHDVRTLAAELERDPLHVDGSRGHDRLAAGEATGERHEVDVGTLGERLPDAVARPEHEVHDALRDAGLLEEPDEVDRRQRRGL